MPRPSPPPSRSCVRVSRALGLDCNSVAENNVKATLLEASRGSPASPPGPLSHWHKARGQVLSALSVVPSGYPCPPRELNCCWSPGPGTGGLGGPIDLWITSDPFYTALSRWGTRGQKPDNRTGVHLQGGARPKGGGGGESRREASASEVSASLDLGLIWEAP